MVITLPQVSCPKSLPLKTESFTLNRLRINRLILLFPGLSRVPALHIQFGPRGDSPSSLPRPLRHESEGQGRGGSQAKAVCRLASGSSSLQKTLFGNKQSHLSFGLIHLQGQLCDLSVIPGSASTHSWQMDSLGYSAARAEMGRQASSLARSREILTLTDQTPTV